MLPHPRSLSVLHGQETDPGPRPKRVCGDYLDHEVDESLVLVAGHRRVRSDHQVAVHLGREVHVLSWTHEHEDLNGRVAKTCLLAPSTAHCRAFGAIAAL